MSRRKRRNKEQRREERDRSPAKNESSSALVRAIEVVIPPRLIRVVTVAAQYSLIMFTFVPILHYNFVVYDWSFADGNLTVKTMPYDIHAEPRADETGPLAFAARAVQLRYNRALEYGRRLCLASTWKMYSPPKVTIRRVQWYVRRGIEGEWEEVPTPNLLEEHRNERSAASTWLWDFKHGRVFGNYFGRHNNRNLPDGRKPLMWFMMRCQLRKIAAERGWDTRETWIRVKATDAKIPTPDKKGDWTPYTAEYDILRYDLTFPPESFGDES